MRENTECVLKKYLIVLIISSFIFSFFLIGVLEWYQARELGRIGGKIYKLERKQQTLWDERPLRGLMDEK